METPQEYFDNVIEEYVSRRNLLITELNKLEGVKVATPQGAFYCVVELPIADADHFAQWLLESFELHGSTVMVAPAAGFYATPGLGKNQIRIAYVLEKEQLVKAVQILGKALNEYNAQ